jgi:hypothetical protein
MKTQAECLCIYVPFCFIVINTTSAQSPHGWRRPNRDGIYPETGLLTTWPLDGSELLLETMDIGKGYFCPINVVL